jgi:hypothetical protein
MEVGTSVRSSKARGDAACHCEVASPAYCRYTYQICNLRFGGEKPIVFSSPTAALEMDTARFKRRDPSASTVRVIPRYAQFT